MATALSFVGRYHRLQEHVTALLDSFSPQMESRALLVSFTLTKYNILLGFLGDETANRDM